MSKDALKGCWLMIDGEPYCQVLEMFVGPEFMGLQQHRLILDKPVFVSLLEMRKFSLRMDAENEIRFDAYAECTDETGLSILGRPGQKV